MKSKWMAIVSLGAMLMPFSAFAATQSEKVTFRDPVTLNGTQLPAGAYRVEWDGTGNVTARIAKGKKVVATVPATVELKNTGYDGATETEGKELKAIDFKNVELRFQAGTSNAQGQ
jgi:hypothetical protein